MAELQTKYDTERKEKEAEIYRLKNVELVRMNDELQLAHDEISAQQEQIQSSIRYARRIQRATLLQTDMLDQLAGEHFILYQPKAIVSGDFYWCAPVGDLLMLAVVDCTGHGVPGAFMSLIGSSLLNRIILERHILDPASILTELHSGVVTALQQDADRADSRDGMDVVLVSIDRLNRRIIFAGAHRPLWVVRQDHASAKLCETKGDRWSIGGTRHIDRREFTSRSLAMQGGDMVYLCTDGFADQRGVNGRKFSSKALKKLLVQLSGLSLAQQKEELQIALDNHQGTEEQMDDITIMGVKFS